MVGYKKDKTFVDEQQLRRLQQMSIMQQHIKEAAKLPPEAAAKLVDATYTLCKYLVGYINSFERYDGVEYC